MSGNKFIIILTFVLVLALALVAPGYLFTKNTTQFNMSAQVIKISGPDTKIGFAAQTDELNFGRVPLGGRSTKFIDVSNTFDSPVKLKAHLSGNITPLIDLSEQEVLLGPKESTQMRVTFNSNAIGNYSGNINIISHIPKYSLCHWLLEYL